MLLSAGAGALWPEQGDFVNPSAWGLQCLLQQRSIHLPELGDQ